MTHHNHQTKHTHVGTFMLEKSLQDQSPLQSDQLPCSHMEHISRAAGSCQPETSRFLLLRAFVKKEDKAPKSFLLVLLTGH